MMLKKIKLFLKEIAETCRFFYGISEKEKRIVFYVENKNYYPNFEGLIDCLIHKYRQNICYVTSDPIDPILKTEKPNIKAFYIDKLLAFFMAFVNCRVLVMTMTDLDQFHIKRSINPVQYVYIFHSLVSTHMVYRLGAFDRYDIIMCAGPHHHQEIRKHEKMNKLPTKRLIEIGYYRLERIYEAYKKYTGKNAAYSSKGVVLIAPSWGQTNVLEFCGRRLIDLLLRNKYRVIVRPHPETLHRTPATVSLLAEKFGCNPNFILETNIVSDESLLRADILISDFSGVALEYAFGTERPVLFLDVPKKIRNERYEALGSEPLEIKLRSEIGVVVAPDKLHEVPDMIEWLIGRKDLYQKRLTLLREQVVYNFGRSSEVGAEFLTGIASDKDKEPVA